MEDIISIQEIIEKVKDSVILDFATVDRTGAPQVRKVSAFHFDGTTLYFLTARGKPFARQLIEDGRLQILAYTYDLKEAIRLYGKVFQVPDDEQIVWRDRIYEEQPYLENVYPGRTKEIDTIFCLKDYAVEYFRLSTRPITRCTLSVGEGKPVAKGYEIDGDRCIGCGTCARWCPQDAIDKGRKYHIRPNNCLQCGSCFEHCPKKAVIRLGE